MSRFTPLLIVAPALLLSACGTYNGGVDSVYQPVVERNDYAFDVQTAGYSLAPGEPERLRGWFGSMGLRYGDRVSVDDGGSGSPSREAVAKIVSTYGLTLSDQTPVTVGQIAPGTVRVIVTRMNASVPNCPDYSRQYQPDFSASTSSNYGCAINSNLAAMVASPGDLVRGESGTGLSDPITGARAVNARRGATLTGGGGTVVRGESAGGSR
jgi:pilus assembly protein CpaD